MPRPTRPPKPIESFGPELLAALIEGSKRPVVLKLSWNKAAHFRQRVNQLRNAMRLKDHPQYRAVSQAKVSISWPEGTKTKKYPGGNVWPEDPMTLCTLTISPQDSEFKDILEAAGVKVRELTPDSPPPRTVPDGLEDDPLARFLLGQEEKEVK